jgi:hypothetical protein
MLMQMNGRQWSDSRRDCKINTAKGALILPVLTDEVGTFTPLVANATARWKSVRIEV